ncbi:MAG TPA: hypothetical protein GXZ45_09040 [Propionibacterium sp.]|nr:hypothetical protein [Propionibacterium sp.]
MRSLGRLLVIAGTFGTAVAQWAIVLIFTNVYGLQAAGEYILLYAIATPAFVAAQLGLRDVYLTLAQRFSRRSYVLLRLAGVVVGVAVLVAVGLARGLPTDLTLALAAMKVGESAIDLRYAFVQSQHAMTRLGVLMVAYAGGMLVVVAGATVLVGNPAVPVALTGLLGVGLALVDTLRPLASPDASPGGWGPIVRAAVPVTLAQLVFALVSSTPVLLIEALGGDRDTVAVYGAAAYLLIFANLVGASAQTLLVPGYRDLEASGRRGDLLASARRTFLGLTALAAVGAVAAIALGPQVLAAVYGPDFAMERVHLTPLVLAAALIAPVYILNALLLVLNAYRAGTVSALATWLGLIAFGVLTHLLTGSPILAASWAALGGSLTRLFVSSAMVATRMRRTTPAPRPSPEGSPS